MQLLELSADQQEAMDTMVDWLASDKPELSLGGLAGTGKTTMLSVLAVGDHSPLDAVLTPTGKAAHVLRTKDIPAGTIHSAIYRFVGSTPIEGKRPQPLFEFGQPTLRAGNIVGVDESSMVTQGMADDLRSLGLRILWVGDHGQLEPVGADPGIMTKPDIRLETVHRQALDSSIIKMAHGVRNGESFPAGWQDDQVTVAHLRNLQDVVTMAMDHDYDQIIVGYNKLRHTLNKIYRKRLGFEKVLVKGDRIICLQNASTHGIYNGMQFEVTAVEEVSLDELRVTITDGDQVWENLGIYTGAFADKSPHLCPVGLEQFDYAYAVTCHKAQGSEWPSVIVLDCSNPHWDNNRWRYTAMTRAKERLLVAL